MIFQGALCAIGVLLKVLPSSLFTFLSRNELSEKRIVDYSAFLAKKDVPLLGCEVHAVAIAAIILNLFMFLLSRHYTKEMNRFTAARRQRVRLLKGNMV